MSKASAIQKLKDTMDVIQHYTTWQVLILLAGAIIELDDKISRLEKK